VMQGIGILSHKELSEGWRTRRLPVVVGLFLVMGIVAPVIAKLTPDIVRASAGAQLAAALPAPTAADAVDQLLKTLGELGAFVAVLLAMGAVATDRERGTAAMVLTKPVGRGAYLVAKLVGLALTLAAGVALAGLATAFYTWVLFQPLPVAGFAGAIVLLWVQLMVPTVVTFLGSVVARSAVAAAGIGFGWVVLSGLVSALPSVGADMPAALAAQARVLALGLPGQTTTPLVVPLLVSVALASGAMALAWRAFACQEV
jgi:ABC-2 type transport system permease protein